MPSWSHTFMITCLHDHTPSWSQPSYYLSHRMCCVCMVCVVWSVVCVLCRVCCDHGVWCVLCGVWYVCCVECLWPWCMVCVVWNVVCECVVWSVVCEYMHAMHCVVCRYSRSIGWGQSFPAQWNSGLIYHLWFQVTKVGHLLYTECMVIR